MSMLGKTNHPISSKHQRNNSKLPHPLTLNKRKMLCLEPFELYWGDETAFDVCIIFQSDSPALNEFFLRYSSLQHQVPCII